MNLVVKLTVGDAMPLAPGLTQTNMNILAIDPGLNNAGIALIRYSYLNKQIQGISAYTVKPEQHINKLYLDAHLDERTMKLIVLKNIISSIINGNHLDLIICEAPFFYASKPAAYRALVEVITILKQTTADINPLIPFIQLEPLMVKRLVKSLNIHEKDSTKEALEVLGMDRFIDLNLLDEHSIDAISIGYAFLKSRELLGG